MVACYGIIEQQDVVCCIWVLQCTCAYNLGWVVVSWVAGAIQCRVSTFPNVCSAFTYCFVCTLVVSELTIDYYVVAYRYLVKTSNLLAIKTIHLECLEVLL